MNHSPEERRRTREKIDTIEGSKTNTRTKIARILFVCCVGERCDMLLGISESEE